MVLDESPQLGGPPRASSGPDEVDSIPAAPSIESSTVPVSVNDAPLPVVNTDVEGRETRPLVSDAMEQDS